MAAVEVTISGVLYDKLNRTMQNVVLIGEASLTGVGIGGGPIIPPGGGGQPPAGGSPGHPSHPIYPGEHPEHPIVNPPPGGGTPPIDPATPPVSWKPIWTPSDGWVVVGVIDPSIEHPVPSGK